jgi:hypothetical protein
MNIEGNLNEIKRVEAGDSEKAVAPRPARPYISIYGKKKGINIGKDVVRLLGCPSHICLLVNERSNAIAIQSCAENKAMSFKVPDMLMNEHWHFRIYSQQFIRTLMTANNMEQEKTYAIPGSYSERHNAVIFQMSDGKLVN